MGSLFIQSKTERVSNLEKDFKDFPRNAVGESILDLPKRGGSTAYATQGGEVGRFVPLLRLRMSE